MFINFKEQQGAHLLSPVFGNPCVFSFKKIIYRGEPKVQPNSKMFRGYGIAYFIIHFLVRHDRIPLVNPL